jgi:hypothetical protein
VVVREQEAAASDESWIACVPRSQSSAEHAELRRAQVRR